MIDDTYELSGDAVIWGKTKLFGTGVIGGVSFYSGTLDKNFTRDIRSWLIRSSKSFPGLVIMIIVACFNLCRKYSVLRHQLLYILQNLLMVFLIQYFSAQLAIPSRRGDHSVSLKMF